jgi:hypothetical protein
MTSREQALDRIATLAREHGIAVAEIEARLAEDRGSSEQKSSALGQILAYLGGIFVFSGLVVFVSLNWDAMNSAARVIVSLGSGLAAFVMAIVAVNDPRFRKAATPLFLIAAALQPTGILVALDEFSSGNNWRLAVLITCGIMIFQQGAVFWKYRRSTLLFTTIAFSLWFLGTTFDLLDADWELVALVLGVSTVGLCIGLERTPHREIVPFWYVVGAGSAYGGLFGLVEGTAVELVFLLAASGGLVLSAWLRRRTLLIVSTIAILAFISYFTAEHFVDSIGWPLALVLLGIVLLLLSAMALRISRRYIRSSAA